MIQHTVKVATLFAAAMIIMAMPTTGVLNPAFAQNPESPAPYAAPGAGAPADYAPSVQTNPSASQISMSIFPVIRGENGTQYIITKAGYQIAVPGLGLAPDANQIAVYRDGANNFWYQNRNNQAVRVSPEQMQSVYSQMQLQAQATRERMINQPPAYNQPMQQPMQQQPMQQQPPVQVSQVVQQAPPTNSSGGGSSALVTGLAAAGGAMAGSALTNSLYNNSYNGIPYGSPLYHDGNRYYYNGANGNKVYASGNNPYVNQWNRQQTWDNMSPNQKAATENVAKNNVNQRQQYNQTKSNAASKAKSDYAAGDRPSGGRRFRGRR